MTEDNTDQISDADIFNEATSEAPIETTPEPAQEADKAESHDGRQRDEKGRFAAKAEGEAVEAKPEVEAHEPAPVEESKQDHRIPLTELLNEREKRQAAERDRETVRQQLWQLQQQLQQAQAKPQEPIDMFADPDGYRANVEHTMDQRLRHMEANFSLRLASYKHGETFQEAFQEVMSRSLNDPMRQQVIASPDPGETMVQLYQREKVIGEVGADPTAYVNKKLEEALNDPEFLAKAIERARTNAGTRPAQNKINLPPSLNKVAAARDSDTGDGSGGSIYHYATR